MMKVLTRRQHDTPQLQFPRTQFNPHLPCFRLPSMKPTAPGKNERHVTRNDIPVWLRQRAAQIYQIRPATVDKGSRRRELCKSQSYAHHHGTIENGSIFVIEPYGRLGDDWSRAKAYAESIHCDLVISEESYHYPPKTIRLAFVPRLLFERLLDPKVITPLSEYDPTCTSHKPEEH